MIDTYREGVLVKPYERLNQEQVQWLDQASLSILADPGIWCYNERAAKLFQAHGAKVWEDERSISRCWRVTFPEGLIREILLANRLMFSCAGWRSISPVPWPLQ